MVSPIDIFSQNLMNGKVYRSIEDFRQASPTDSITFSVHRKADKFINERCKLKIAHSTISQYYLQDYILMVYNPQYLFLNLSILKIANGFVQIPNPKTYNYFIGRPQKGEFNEAQFTAAITMGAIAAAAQGSLKDETRKSVSYIFSLETGKLYPFIPETLDRLMEPFTELSMAYRIEPSRNDKETMLIYLDILNEMVEK